MDKWQAMVQVMFEAQLHALVPYGFQGSAQGIKDFTMQLNDIMHSHPRGSELVDLGENGVGGVTAQACCTSILVYLDWTVSLFRIGVVPLAPSSSDILNAHHHGAI